MSQNIPSHLEGHIDAPNPLELFWEKNKRIVMFGAVAAAIAIVLNYVIQFQAQRARSEKWSELATSTALDLGYVEHGSSWSFLQSQLATNPQYLAYYASMTQVELVNDMAKDIEKADVTKLESLAKGSDERAPLALWALANRSFLDADFDGAKRRAEDLKGRFGSHFLCRESPHPIQWQAEVKKEGEDKDATPRPNQKPILEPAVAGSAVGELLARIDRSIAFRAEHSEFYVPKQPNSAESVTFEFENAGSVTIRFFSEQSPKHVERFLALAREGWWQGQRVYEVRRESESMSGASTPGEFAFGWPSTKSDDRTEWKAGDLDPANIVDWEASDLSHFEGTVAVEIAKDGKSQVERIVITGKDVADQADGSRVIIGRVTSGLDVVKTIVDSGFADEASRQQGRGMPEDNFTIKSVTIQ